MTRLISRVEMIRHPTIPDAVLIRLFSNGNPPRELVIPPGPQADAMLAALENENE
jgi:hypothetical protein